MIRMLAATVLMLLLATSPASAQEPLASASIDAGSCDNPQSTVTELQSLLVPIGEPVGAPGGQTAATSFTTAPVALDSLISSDHVIVLSSGGDNTACGEIGGVQESQGALAIVLSSDTAGMVGIAYLSVSPVDPSSTGVSLFVGTDALDGSGDSSAAGTGDDSAQDAAQSSGPTPESTGTESTDPETSTQAADTATNDVAPARSDDPGTRTNPLPLGTSAEIGGGWYASVVDVNFDATDLILAENMFNDPPAPGQQFVMLTISATYEGPEESSELPTGNAFKLVGDSSVSYISYDPGCGVIPNDLPRNEVFRGGTITGNICFAVDADDVDSLVMFTEDFVTYDRDVRAWFALR